MAKTGVATGDNAAVKLWNEKLFRDSIKESYFSRFMGTGDNSIMQVKTDLEGKKGDRVRFAMVPRLTGAGVSEGQTLEGNEEALNEYTFDLTLQQWRHAVRDDGSMSRQRSMYDIPEASLSALRGRTTEKIDEEAFAALQLSPTKTIYASTATSEATLTTAMVMTPDLISEAKAWAKTGGNRAQTPLRPVRIDGKDHYVMLVHPDVGYDLKQDSTWQNAQQYANVRGMSNPLFSGALGMWDNVIIHEHEEIDIVTNFGAGANVPGARCIFMGAQALCWAWGQRPEIVSKKFDFENEEAFAVSMIYDVAKPVFNSLDYGSISIDVARTQISDA